MVMLRESLAVGAEISVVADCALVAIANNIRILVHAKRSIAMYAIMALDARGWIGYGFVQWDEAMTKVVTSSILDTARAVIPIRAIQALVADTNHVLYDVSMLFDEVFRWHTLSHPSQIAAWRTLRPGAKSLLANMFSVVCSEAGIKAWLG